MILNDDIARLVAKFVAFVKVKIADAIVAVDRARAKEREEEQRLARHVAAVVKEPSAEHDASALDDAQRPQNRIRRQSKVGQLACWLSDAKPRAAMMQRNVQRFQTRVDRYRLVLRHNAENECTFVRSRQRAAYENQR